MANIALVDDDDMLRQILADNLRAIGHGVVEFSDRESMYSALTDGSEAVDLMILDWALPGGTGLDLLKQLRAAGVAAPALFFTSHNDTLYEEAALACGAVDFVDKTRSFAILSKRIALILEHTPLRAAEVSAQTANGLGGNGSNGTAVTGQTPLPVSDVSINAALHEVRLKGRLVNLTFGEFRVVDLLVNAGRDVGYREIYDVLKGDDFVAGDGPEGYRANVRAMIKRIRQKFCDIDPGFDLIRNYPGFGYRWGGSDG